MTFWRSLDSGTVKIVIPQRLSFFSWILVPGLSVDDVDVLPPSEVLSVLPPESTQYSTLSEHSLRKSTLTDTIFSGGGADGPLDPELPLAPLLENPEPLGADRPLLPGEPLAAFCVPPSLPGSPPWLAPGLPSAGDALGG
jgi:hypothetical protein